MSINPISVRLLPGFNPTQISGCQLWLDAADTTTYTSSSSVTSWRNKGTAGGTCSRTNGTFDSTSFTINSLRAMAFSSGATMSMPTLTFGTTSRSIFLVPNIGASGSQYTYTSAGSLVDPQCYSWSGGADLELNRPSLNIIVANNPTNYFNKSSVVSITSGININGTAQTTSVNRGNNLFTAGVTTTLILGGSDTVAYNLGEIIIFDGLLNTTQTQQLEGYLAWKWGLQTSLPSDHPYKTTPPQFFPPLAPFPLVSQPTSITFAPIFLPTSISGCTLWLDGADISTITGTSPVTAWKDKSGNGNNPTTISGVTYSTNQQGGYGTINMGSGYITGSIASPIINTIVTCFLVVKCTSTTNDNGIHGALTLNQVGQLYDFRVLEERQANFRLLTRYPNVVGVSTGAITSSYIIWTAIASSSSLSANINGSTISTSAITTDPNNASVYNIGTTSESGVTPVGWNGYIAEEIIYSGTLNNTQIQQVEGYLAWKWGLVANLPSNHPYKSINPSPYYNKVQVYTNKVIPYLFNPTQISGTQFWLDAADPSVVIKSGTTVTAWNDKSGNGYNLNALPMNNWQGQGNAIYPSVGTAINNLNTIYFSAWAGLKQGTVLNGAKNLYWVGRIASGGTTYFLMGADSYYDWHANGGPGTTILASAYAQSGILAASPASQYTSGANAVVNTSFSNIVYPSAGDISLLSVAGITGNTRYQGVCFDRQDHTGWCGDLGEVVIYSTALTTAQHQQVEGYLAWKWGLQGSLPATHPYKLFPPPPS